MLFIWAEIWYECHLLSDVPKCKEKIYVNFSKTADISTFCLKIDTFPEKVLSVSFLITIIWETIFESGFCFIHTFDSSRK